jgi:hypothetical protein
MTQHLELLVEEPSAEAFLRGLLPRLLPPNRTFEVYPFQGKQDLLDKLEARLRGYAAWLPAEWRIVVVVDRDDDDCRRLKQRMEQIANRAGLRTKRSASSSWQLVNRIAIEELEAWYFGDWEAVRAAFPRVSRTVPRQSRYREPDAITGGTWEAFERILQRHGYFKGGLPKIDVARVLGQHVDHTRCHSPSFVCFRDVVLEAVQ